MYFRIIRFSQVKKIYETITKNDKFNNYNVYLKDAFGSIADARSLLGMMALNYTKPVKIECSNNDLTNFLITNLENC